MFNSEWVRSNTQPGATAQMIESTCGQERHDERGTISGIQDSRRPEQSEASEGASSGSSRVLKQTVARPDRSRQMENEIKVRFIVMGFDQEPGAITELLRIDPTETWMLGEPMVPSPIRIHEENG
jgi:hypothetical protein